jgi:predicted CoA-substrate-specific enzyme activase
MHIIGLDAGSVSVKGVALDEKGEVLQRQYTKHQGQPLPVALEILKMLARYSDRPLLAITGSAGKLLGGIFGVDPLNEIAAQAYATKRLYPHIKTIIEMGGEDSKLIMLDEDGMQDFSMNSVCAAGTGSFLDQQAERLKLTIEEFSELSLASQKPPRIAGRCSVFAKSDMIHLQQIATPVEEIIAGLCFAVARNFRSTIARGRSIAPPVSFHGGVAANKGMVRAFREVLGLDELFVPPDYALMGALGAAMKARDERTGVAFRLEALEAHLLQSRESQTGHQPLLQQGDGFSERHVAGSWDSIQALPAGAAKVQGYMGIDVGSISTNVAVIDANGKLLCKRYLMTAGRPIEAVRQGMQEAFAALGERVEIAGVGTTGSGRYMIADYVGADIVKNEITAQATAAVFIDPAVDTVFEIGGQDSKYISLENGLVVDFEMNKACAAGTGSFLEEQAEKLSISIKQEFAKCAFSSRYPTKLGDRCTVFMENSLMANLHKGISKNDLLAGLAYSIVQNYLNRVVAGRPVGRRIFFQGGVAFNKSVVAAFEKHLGMQITVPPNHDVTGAIGMALLVMRHMASMGESRSSFKGFDLVEQPYEISSFSCGGCSNICEINRVKIEGEKNLLFYGGRCEKYDVNRKRTTDLPDLFKFRDELLWRTVPVKSENRPHEPVAESRGKIGIPYVFFFNEYLPFWAAFFTGLRFSVEVSPRHNRQIVDYGLEDSPYEACFPAKVAIGHIRHLKEQGVDAIFLPSFVNLNTQGDEYPLGVSCPYTQTIPYLGKLTVTGVDILTPAVDMSRDRETLVAELGRCLKRFGVARREIRDALAEAEQAQGDFTKALQARGREVLGSIQDKVIVIVGRAYNAFESGMNLRIPEKLNALGTIAIPMDMLPLEDCAIAGEWPNMYWRSGQKMLRAARFIAGNDKLYPVIIGSFSCGPDSFIMKYLKDELRGKPFLHIEIDEHSADAGAITRCEAFLDSIGNSGDRNFEKQPGKRSLAFPSMKNRKVYIPAISDHAPAAAAAFERCGVEAEVLPEPNRETYEMGMKYVSGKECYPCAITTGDMLRKALSRGFDPSRSAFFMPSGSGPCRFGQYNVFHRTLLDSIGLQEVLVFAPNQDEAFFNSLEAVRDDFALHAGRGIVAVDVLLKCLHASRPYERRKGQADELYQHHLRKLVNSVSGRDGRLDDALKNASKDFANMPRTAEIKPLIGIIGEVYVRNNRFSNEDIVAKVEKLGGEVLLATLGEWISYVNAMNFRRDLQRRDFRSAAVDAMKRIFHWRIEKRYAAPFKGFVNNLYEPSVRQLLKMAAPYIADTFEGEAVLSIGKSVELAKGKASGIINTIPFGCMPGTIVAGVMQSVRREYDIPFITVAYDGTESSGNEIQLEAFMAQAKASLHENRH